MYLSITYLLPLVAMYFLLKVMNMHSETTETAVVTLVSVNELRLRFDEC